MNSREIVRRTLTYEHPERVADSFGVSDFVSAGPRVDGHATEWREVDAVRWERTDEWGNTWARLDPVSKGEVVKGVLDDLGDVETLVLPDYGDAAAYAPVREARAAHPDKWLIGSIPGFAFNIARKLRRIDCYLADLLMDPDRVHHLNDRVDDLLERMILLHAEAGVDAIMFPEDWGTQAELFIDPKLWRAEFGPRYERLCAAAHGAGVKVFLHSCGQIESVVPDMIAAGVDLFQFDQPELHGLDTLAGHQDRCRVTFWCPVDIQKTLQTRDEARIRAMARTMLDKLWRGRGGFVAGYYGDNVSIGLEPEWQAAACDEFTRYGVRASFAR